MKEEFQYNTVEEAIAAIKAGKMVLVTDDEDRENEGDLIMSAELCTPEAINFMAKEARGLICMPAAGEIMDKLQFGAMVSKNTDNHETAFSVSIDHADTTTGISAYERAYTMKKCTEEGAQPSDFRRPGHVFPLRAREGGVLVRIGHTEATVDLCKLAGLKPVGICCEIMKDDGHMARTPDLIEFARQHDLVFITVASLVAYRKKNEKMVHRVAEAALPTKYGNFRIIAYENDLEHLSSFDHSFGGNPPERDRKKAGIREKWAQKYHLSPNSACRPPGVEAAVQDERWPQKNTGPADLRLRRVIPSVLRPQLPPSMFSPHNHRFSGFTADSIPFFTICRQFISVSATEILQSVHKNPPHRK